MERTLVRAVVLAVLLGTVLPAAAGPATADSHLTTVTVITVDRDGERVGNVDFSVTWNDSEEVVNGSTRSNGRALVDVPRGADVRVRVTDETYIRNTPQTFADVESEQELRVPVSLPGTAAVTVVDENGAVRDARVRLRGRGADITRRTDAEGRVSIGPVERGNYDLRVGKPGYLTNSTQVPVGATTERTVTIREANRGLSVTVVDDRFDPARPVANATVDIRGVGTLVTGTDGERTTSVAVNRDYRLSVTKDGYETVTQTVSVGESDGQYTVAINREEGITIDATSRRVVVGESTRLTVTDEYGDPVQGAVVSLGETEVGETNDRGEYDLRVDAAGNSTVTVVNDGLSATVTVEGVEPGSAGTETATATETATETATDSPSDPIGGVSPGFGPVAALAALGLLAARRRV